MSLSHFNLVDMVAIVTSASGGIAKAIALSSADSRVAAARSTSQVESSASEMINRASRAIAVLNDVHRSYQGGSLMSPTVRELGKPVKFRLLMED